ncbi:hypothetical protein NDY24_13700 [Xanthomonas hortorum pv. pelargonii]|nr:hypothetical protein NDY24_13700 [Xanthomonas hortorum pv. pelargonii]
MLHKINQYESQFLHLIAAERPKARISDKLVKLEEGDYAVSWPPAEEANAGLLRPDKGLGEGFAARPKNVRLYLARFISITPLWMRSVPMCASGWEAEGSCV